MKLKIIGICGSLRKKSINRILLEMVKEYIPENTQFEIVEIGNLPFFNQDNETNPPSEVIQFRNTIKNADAIIFTTPEYNYSISAVLKNAIEWGSRPYGLVVLNGKPVAIMGASTGMIGTARAQGHLRQICAQVNMYPLNKPEVLVTSANEKIDQDGNIIDTHTKDKIKELVNALINWSLKINNDVKKI